jgi:hypothetical protein
MVGMLAQRHNPQLVCSHQQMTGAFFVGTAGDLSDGPRAAELWTCQHSRPLYSYLGLGLAAGVPGAPSYLLRHAAGG